MPRKNKTPKGRARQLLRKLKIIEFAPKGIRNNLDGSFTSPYIKFGLKQKHSMFILLLDGSEVDKDVFYNGDDWSILRKIRDEFPDIHPVTSNNIIYEEAKKLLKIK